MGGARSMVVVLVVAAGLLGACGDSGEEPSSAPVSATASNTPTTEAVFPTATAPPESVSFRPVVTGPASSGSQDDLPALDQLGPVVVDGRGIVGATAARGSSGDEWEVRLELVVGASGIDAFNAIATVCAETGEGCPAGQLALVVDGEVVTAPTIATPPFEADQIAITGGSDQAQAEDIARRISAGSHG